MLIQKSQPVKTFQEYYSAMEMDRVIKKFSLEIERLNKKIIELEKQKWVARYVS